MTSIRRSAAVSLAAALLASTLGAGLLRADGPRAAPIKDRTVAKECSACHMLYPAVLLPARSWQALMANLKDHFGDNAELDDAIAKQITDYLVANAGDERVPGGRRPAEVKAGAVPLRISEMPWFVRKHEKKGRIASATLQRRGAKSPADCKACHPGAESGLFDDD